MALERLKALRLEKGLSQTELARQLGTTQQTVARWESGKAVPSVSSLDNLAYVLGTTVAYLLGQRPTSRLSKSFQDVDEQGVFWGHLGLRMPQWRQTQWYPITDTERGHVWSRLRNLQTDDDEDTWIICETLNNRILAFNPDALGWVCLLDDDADGPEGDWTSKFPLDDYAGHPLAIYRAMDEWVSGAWGIDADSQELRIQREVVENLLRRAKLDDPDKLHAFLHHTLVYLRDGRRIELFVEPPDLWFALSGFELALDRLAYLPTHDHLNEMFVSVHQLALVDAPLIDVDEARRKELGELGVTDEEDDVATKESPRGM